MLDLQMDQFRTEVLVLLHSNCNFVRNFVKSANAHPIVDDAAKNMQDAVKDLTDTLEEAASETGAVTGLVESISKAMNEVGLRLLLIKIAVIFSEISKWKRFA
jgi:hypothetical protein